MPRKPREKSTGEAKHFYDRMRKSAGLDTFSFLRYPILSPFRRCRFKDCGTLAVGEYWTADNQLSEGLCDKHYLDVDLAVRGL